MTSSADIDLDLDIWLQPKQAQLYEAITDLDGPSCISFGGSRGGAKSGGIRRCSIGLAMREECVIWIIRRHWDDLNKDHVQQLWREYPELQQFWRAGDKELRLPCEGGGYSSIFFVHAGTGGRPKRKARGPQAHYIFIDQAEEFTQAEIEQYIGSNRGPDKPKGYCKRILGYNPGGVGTAYLRRINNLKQYVENEVPGDFLFIQAYGWDNYEWFRAVPGAPSEKEFYHDPYWAADETFMYEGNQLTTNLHRLEFFLKHTGFGSDLAKLPTAQRIGELFGSFERFAGQYYADVWDAKALVLDPSIVFRILQPWWVRWLATDWGFSHYAATNWACSGILSPAQVLDLFHVECSTPLRIIVVYREFVCRDTAEPDLAGAVAKLTADRERREVRNYWLSPDAWAKRGGGNTVQEQMQAVLDREGMPTLQPAKNDRVGGWRLLYNCFAEALKLRTWSGPQPFSQDEADPPALFISAACPEIVKAIPLLIADEKNPTDIRKIPGAVEDDVADCLRYLLKSYLDAEPQAPGDVVRREVYDAYQDPTSRAMILRKLEAEQTSGRYLRRRAR